MKQKLLFLLMALLSSMFSWADVEINETNFPDEKFRNWVLSQSYGADGMLTDDEIADKYHEFDGSLYPERASKSYYNPDFYPGEVYDFPDDFSDDPYVDDYFKIDDWG